MGEIRTHDIVRLPVEAVSANEKITFVKNVVLPGERKYTIFFSPEAASVLVSQMPPQNSLCLSWRLTVVAGLRRRLC